MCDLTRNEKALIVQTINLLADRGLLQSQGGGINGLAQLIQAFNTIIQKLSIDASQVTMPNGATLQEIMQPQKEKPPANGD